MDNTKINKKVLEKMKKFDLYQGMDKLNDVIMMQDEVDDRFVENDLIELLSCTMIYHQIVECMIHSLLIHYEYIKALEKNSYMKSKYRNIKGFGRLKNEIEKLNFGDFFENKKEFLKECGELNKLRNKLAHEIIGNNHGKLIAEINKVKTVYHNIQSIYQTTAVKIFNYIHKQIDDFSILELDDI